MFNVDCSSCGSRFLVKPEHADQAILCPKCGAALSAPLTEVEVLSDVTPAAVADGPLAGPPREKKTAVKFLVVALTCAAATVVLMAVAWWLFLARRVSDPIAESSGQRSPPSDQPEKTPAQADIRKTSRDTPKSPPEVKPAPVSLADLIEALDDGVVLIKTLDQYDRPAGFGSGFVIDASGLIATNYHVLKDVMSAKVQMHDGTNIDVLGVRACDAEADLIILELAKKPDPLTVLELAPKAKQRPGEEVIALGHPRGFRFTASNGIVSAVRMTEEFPERLVFSLRSWPDTVWIQSTAAISGGNSGGPLLNREGKVIGVNTWGARGENLGFAVHAQHLADLQQRVNEKAVPLEKLTDFAKQQRKINRKLAEERFNARIDPALKANRVAALRIRQSGGIVEIQMSRNRSHYMRFSLDMPIVPFYVLKVSLLENRDGLSDFSILSGLTELTEIHFARTTYGDKEILQVTDLAKLDYFSAMGPNVTDVAAAHLKRFTSLTRLSLQDTAVSDRGVAEFKSLRNLKSISLTGSKITDAAADTLRELPELESISVMGTKVTGRFAGKLAKLGKLTRLDLSNTEVADDSIDELSKLNTVTLLELSGTKISEAKFGVFLKLPKLTRLRLKNLRFGDVGIDHLSGAKNLRSLSLSNVPLSKEQIQRLRKALPNCIVNHNTKPPVVKPRPRPKSKPKTEPKPKSQPQPKPKPPQPNPVDVAKYLATAKRVMKAGGRVQVRIIGGSFTLKYCKSIEELPKDPFELHSVTYSRTFDDVLDFSFLSGLKSLRRIDLPYSKATDAAVATLTDLPELTSLSVSGSNKITDATLESVRQFPRLMYLRLNGTSITDRGLIHVKKLSELRELSLSKTKITDAAMAQGDCTISHYPSSTIAR